MRTTLALAALLLACDGPAPPPSGDTLYSLLAVGDAGRVTWLPRLFEGQMAVAHGMTAEHARDAVSAVVMLGDNFYWHGLTNENLVERLNRNVALPYCAFVQLGGSRSDALRESCSSPGGDAVRLFALLGNHDLESPDSERLQREVVPEFVSNWKMSRGMVEAVELGHGISLVLFESELMLGRDLALDELTRAIAEAPGPWRIVASHRPIGMGERGESPESAGGFPLLVQAAIRAAQQPVHLYLAGHEHNLQLLEGEGGAPALIAIVGSGSRASTPLGPTLPSTRFGAERLGFARVDLTREGGRGERLVLSFFASPRLPLLAYGAPELLARWSVSLSGEVREERSSR